jgi:hypothetical protein
MKNVIQLKLRLFGVLIAVELTIAWLVLAPGAQAVVPAPDGGYPRGNTAEGQSALLSLTTGGFNTAVGWLSLRSNSEATFNTAVGAAALFANATAVQNTATGAGAVFSHSSGNGNTANGAFALFSDTGGQLNTATGSGALFSNPGAFASSFNTATGASALYNNTGGDNTADGATALANNTTGNDNTAVGVSALANNTTGSSNIALGSFAGGGVTTASHVICIDIDGGNVDNSCYIGQILMPPLPEGAPCSLMQTISSVRSLPQGALRKRSNQWTKPATRSSHLSRLRSVTRRRSIQQAHNSWALWPKMWKR